MNMYNDIKFADQKNPILFYIDDRPFAITTTEKNTTTEKKGGNRTTKRIYKRNKKSKSMRNMKNM